MSDRRDNIPWVEYSPTPASTARVAAPGTGSLGSAPATSAGVGPRGAFASGRWSTREVAVCAVVAVGVGNARRDRGSVVGAICEGVGRERGV